MSVPGGHATDDGIEAFADAIVVAAGASTRMGGIDKLGAVVAGLPILAHSLRAIAGAPEVRRIFVVASRERIEAIGEADWLPGKVAIGLAGGERRQDSVAAGFIHLLANPSSDGGPEPEVVLVHDGARPLVPVGLVSAVAHAARAHGAAIPVVPVLDTIKRVGPDGSVAGAGERTMLRAAQTPQGIRTELLREAYARIPADGPETFTDEAALLEACRIPVHAIDGEPGNIKVTVPADLQRAEALLGEGQVLRHGVGHDSHPFGPADGLVLGGVKIPAAPRLHGHSDGDVALHAICDALLGAAGLGDLGRVFPAGPSTPAGIASGEMLAEVVRRVGAAGFRPASLDVTIVAARPRLGAHLDAMRESIARGLGLAASEVNVKASSGNLDGMEGAGRGMSALAVVTVAAIR